MKYIKVLFIFIFFYILINNKELFLRYNYEKYECGLNDLRIIDITIVKDKLDSKVEINIKNFLHIFKIIENNKKKIVLKNIKDQIRIAVNRINGKVSILYKKNTFSFVCQKSSFKI